MNLKRNTATKSVLQRLTPSFQKRVEEIIERLRRSKLPHYNENLKKEIKVTKVSNKQKSY